MNDNLLHKLFEKATNGNGFPISVDSIHRVELEKFAELIAYECMDLALGSSLREDDMGAIIADKIKQHFGVE